MSRASQRMMCFQLALPLLEGGRQEVALPAEEQIAPGHLWVTLHPALQADLCQALLQVLQEVLHDAPHR